MSLANDIKEVNFLKDSNDRYNRVRQSKEPEVHSYKLQSSSSLKFLYDTSLLWSFPY